MNNLTDIMNSNTGNTGADNTFPANGLLEFKEYDSQLSIPETSDSRIVKCLYQINKQTGKKAGENSYIRIPTDHISEAVISERIAELAPYIVGFLQDEEDKLIKAAHKTGVTSLYTPNLTLDAIIEALESSESGSRLNKEKIAAWFDEYLANDLLLKFSEKLGVTDINAITQDQADKIETILEAYKAKFCMLASGKTSFNESDCDALINVLEKTGADSNPIGARFVIRLTKMKEKTQDALLAL